MTEELTTMMQVVRIEETPCDVLLVSGDGTGEGVKAHRDVLCGCSWYFKMIFDETDVAKAKEDDNERPVVHYLPHVNTDCIKSIVAFSYTENFEDTDANVLELLAGAAFLQIPRLVDKCKRYILACLNSDNWILIWRFVRNHFTDVAESVIRYVHNNFDEVVYESDLHELELDELVEIVSVDGIAVSKKKACSDAFFRWIGHDPYQRLAYANLQIDKISTEVWISINDAICQLHNLKG
jgi:hypothetical protein